MREFFDKFDNLKGASFIGIRGYESSKTGKVSDVTLLANASVQNAKLKDLATLKAVDPQIIATIAKSNEIAIEIVNLALSELITSLEKNVSAELSDRTTQSQAQTNAYIDLSPSVKINKESLEVFVSGFLNQEVVLVEGTYPIVKSRPKTIAKKAIEKVLNLRMNAYRIYNIGTMDNVKINGETIQM